MIQQAPHIPRAINALDHSFGLWERAALKTRGAWRIRNHSKNMVPSRVAVHRSSSFIATLSPVAIKAAPGK
jgi:hypothetical protein